jgi:hypothetical protein
VFIVRTKSFNDGDGIQLLADAGISLSDTLDDVILDSGPGTGRSSKDQLKKALRDKGFTTDTRLDPALGWKAQSVHRSGIVVQLELGNLANAMYDIIKFEHLFRIHAVSSLILLAPLKKDAITVGSNIANYEKLENEYLIAFQSIVNLPTQLVGISNTEPKK